MAVDVTFTPKLRSADGRKFDGPTRPGQYVSDDQPELHDTGIQVTITVNLVLGPGQLVVAIEAATPGTAGYFASGPGQVCATGGLWTDGYDEGITSHTPVLVSVPLTGTGQSTLTISPGSANVPNVSVQGLAPALWRLRATVTGGEISASISVSYLT